MTIYKPDGTAFMNIEVDDESYHYAEIMGRDDVTLYFSLPHFVDFQIGSYIMYGAPDAMKTYTLYSVDKMRMEHRRDYEYTITFEAAAVELGNYIFTNPNDGRFKFPLAAMSSEHLSLLCRCLTQKTGETWTVGNTVGVTEHIEKLISYDAMTCLDALKQIADAFETEYSVVGHTVNLGKVEYFTDVAEQVVISYGKGNGLRPGVEKTIDTGEKVIGKVYIQGSDRNIDPSKYPDSMHHSTTLLLPRAGSWYGDYDGHLSLWQMEGYPLRVKTSEDGTCIYFDFQGAPTAEAALDLTEIYPSYEHVVSEAVEVDSENRFWDIYSNTFTAGESDSTRVNYGECLIANGEEMTVIFQSGALSGREFGVKWVVEEVESGGTTTQVPHMEIVPTEQDGFPMPDGTNGFHPAAGDRFKVFNCYLPDSYVEAAEDRMLFEAYRYLCDHCKPKFSIKGEIDPIWSASRWVNIGGHFKPGAYFRFIDPTWEGDGVSVRVSSVKTFINKPHQPIVEMMNGVSKQGVATAIKKAQAEASVLPAAYNKDGRAFTKRSFADAKETMEMLINAGLEGFEASISPITVQTMQLLVGSEQLQFLFFDDSACTIPNSHPYEFNPATKKLEYDAVYLQHQTLGITDIRSSTDTRPLSDYKIWSIQSGESAVLDEPETAYYLYVKCDADNDGSSHNTGEFYLSKTSKGMGPVTETVQDVERHFYYFLAAIINAEREGNRSDAPLFGFTEVLPGQITTDVIRGSSGTSWWDLRQNQLSIGGKLTYSPANGLRLNGALVVNGEGETTVIGAWCGEWNQYDYYKKGDEVWIEDINGLISTYRYISDTRTRNVQPPNENYWQPFAQGKMGRGISGSPVDTFWDETTLNGTTPPSGDHWQSSRPTGNSLRQGEYVWKRTVTTYSDNSTSTTYTSEYYAEDGTNGAPGPWLNSRGEWSDTELYSGSSESCDVVYYQGRWYRAKTTAGEIEVGTYPTGSSSSPWEAFEANFSNVATGLLFAQGAYIDKLGVRILDTSSHPYAGSIHAEKNYLIMLDELNQQKLLITGDDLAALSSTSGSDVRWSSGGEYAIGGSVTLDDYVGQMAITKSENNVSLPAIKVTVRRGIGSGSTRAEELTMTAAYVIDGLAVSSVSENFTLDASETYKEFTLPRTNLKLSTGNHNLYIRITASTPTSNNLSRVEYESGTANITYPSEAVQIGANGFRAAFSTTCYASFVKYSNSVNFEFLNGSYGFRVTSTGFEKTTDGGITWTAVSL